MIDDINSAAANNSKRINHLLSEARKSFMALGYHYVSIDGLSRSSNVSKETIYRYFTDKQQLFRAAMRDVVDDFAVQFTPILEKDASPRQILLECARAILERNNDPHFANPSWLVVGVANSDPELSHLVFHDYFQSIGSLSDYIGKLARLCDERASTEEKALALHLVAQFGALVVGGLNYLMLQDDGTKAKAEVEQSVDLFLLGALGDGVRADAALPYAQQLSIEEQAERPLIKDHIGALMRVSRAHFYERGYRCSSLDEIGAEARVGRGTLYRHFKNKAGLFEAVMDDAASQLMTGFTLLVDTDRPLDQNLRQIGFGVAELMQQADAISLYRTVSAEVRNMPEVSARIYANTRGVILDVVARYFQLCIDAGVLKLRCAEIGAEKFLTLALGGNQYLSVNPAPNAALQKANVERAVKTFLYGITQA